MMVPNAMGYRRPVPFATTSGHRTKRNSAGLLGWMVRVFSIENG
jgi:hypothetical protein